MKATQWLLAASFVGLSSAALAGQSIPTDTPAGGVRLLEAPAPNTAQGSYSSHEELFSAGSDVATDQKNAFMVHAGWLSDAVSQLSDQTGFDSLVWTPDPQGKLDFPIHTTFAIQADTAFDALEELIEPYPLRICYFTADMVLQVKPQNQECQ